MTPKLLSTDEVVQLVLDDEFGFLRVTVAMKKEKGIMLTLVNSILIRQRLLLSVEAF